MQTSIGTRAAAPRRRRAREFSSAKLRAVTLAYVVLATAALPGCDLLGGGSCEPVSPNATIAAVEIHVEHCRYLARCQPDELLQYHGGDVQGCIDYEYCTTRPDPGAVVTGECIESLQALECSEGFDDMSGSVCTYGGPIPPQQVGESCGGSVCREGGDVRSTSLQCGPEAICDANSVCAPAVAEGDACSIPNRPGLKRDPCAGGTYCNFLAGVCTARVPAGGWCDIQRPPSGAFELDPCEGRASCVDNTCSGGQTAAPPSGEVGDTCESGGYPRTCQYGLACVTDVCRVLVCDGDSGASCSHTTCADGFSCNSRSEQCEPTGAKCADFDDYYCSADQFCDTGGTCQRRPPSASAAR